MIYQKGNYYHVFNRGCNKEKICFNNQDYKSLLKKIKQTIEVYEIEVIAYCLMPNHYHFLLYQVSDKPVSEWLKSLFSGYVQIINRKYNRAGTLFERSAKPKLISNDEYLINVIHYIHSNPIKHGLIDHPNAWEFSSLNDYLGNWKGFISKKVLENYFHENWTYQNSFQDYLESKIYLEIDDYKL